jgi:hypothetical protein
METFLFKSTVAIAVLLISSQVSCKDIKKNYAVYFFEKSYIPSKTVKDSTEVRRDEYFKDVQIIIDDKPNNVFINKPYKKLNKTEKEYYLSCIPKKEQARGLQISDYNSFIKNEDGTFYIDNEKVTRDEVLKYKREYFACGGFKRSGKDKRYFFYTYPYFNKNIKSINDHYPDKNYKITILNEAREYQWPDTKPVVKKETYERNGHENDSIGSAEVSFISYAYTDEIKNRTYEVPAHFPGGKAKFIEYLFDNINVPYDLTGQELLIDFTINTDGTLSDISMMESTDPILAAEVNRIMQKSPRWIPAQKNGIPQPVGTRDYFKK